MKRKMMDRLLAWKVEKNRKPLIIKGVRQVGKTHLLKEFGRLHFPSCYYFNFEKEPELAKLFESDLVPQRILQALSFHVGRPIQVGADLVIFDEIQECSKALTSLKYFQEEYPQLHLCSAGSLLGLHLNGSSFPVGKVTFETLRPMSFEEFLMAYDDKGLPFVEQNEPISDWVHAHLWEQFKHYLIVGGLPEIVALYVEHRDNLVEGFSLIRKKQDDVLKSYYADIAKHAGKVNAMQIDRIFQAVPAQLSQVQDASTARFKFRGIVPGISHYDRLVNAIDWLEATGLVLKIHILHTAQIPLKGYIRENMFKLFLFDVGLLGHMAGLSPKTILDYNYGTYKGYFAENFVAQELINSGTESLFNWQETKAEVEFVLEIDGNLIPIEVKSGSITKAQSLKIFDEKYKSAYQIILSGRLIRSTQERTKKHYPLYLAGKVIRDRIEAKRELE